MLQSETLSPDDRLLVMQAIADFKSKPRSKSSELKKARIVGCTCASLAKSIMDDQQFDIVIVDEATQVGFGVWVLGLWVWGLDYGVCDL